MKGTTITSLFVSRDGKLAVRLLDSPVQPEYYDVIAPEAPAGLLKACMLMGQRPFRTFKRTTRSSESLPVFEEQ